MKPLIIFEMANNHGGNHDVGLDMIVEFTKVKNQFPQFQYGFKFQYRDLASFIHPDYKDRDDIPYVKRFKDTNLGELDRVSLKTHAQLNGFRTVCTPFDEESVHLVGRHEYDVLKVGSPSIKDWDLWDEILLRWQGPIIASLGGAYESDIDYVVELCRERELTLMHCVSEYPAPNEMLELNQIDWLKDRYPGTRVGYSSHESPEGDGCCIALAKNAEVFEWHVALEPTPNGYSLTPTQSALRLERMSRAWASMGSISGRVAGNAPTQFTRTRCEDGRMRWIPRT